MAYPHPPPKKGRHLWTVLNLKSDLTQFEEGTVRQKSSLAEIPAMQLILPPDTCKNFKIVVDGDSAHLVSQK